MENNKLSPLQRIALQVVDYVRERIINQECTDDELAESLNKINFETHKDYFKKEDYCTADKAYRILKLGSRSKFFEVAKKYNIQNHKLEFKDMGYKIEDLYRVKELLDKERERDV